MNKDAATTEELAPRIGVMDDVLVENFDLDPHLINLMWNEPFFSKILRIVSKVRTTAIPTAGVLAKDGDVKLWWNPNFVAGLTSLQIKGLLKHESYHLVFEHTTTRRMDPHIVWNYATDLAINSLIPEEELPEGGLVPGKAFKKLTEEQTEKMSDTAIEKYGRLSEKIASFPKEEAADWYFAQLMEDPEDFENEGGEGMPGDGEGAGDFHGTMDDHGGWGNVSDEEKELIRGKVKEALKDAVNECDQKGAWGSVGANTRGILREMVSNEISWKAVLKQFCGMSKRGNRSTNIRRLNRKYPAIHPGSQKGYTSSIAIYIDQSGSVGDGELELLFAELRNLAKHTEFTCYHFDSTVDVDSEATWRKGKTPVAHRTRCGGTNFKVVSDHANKNRSRFDGYLILTDGYANDPGPSKLRRGWVITPQGSSNEISGNKKDFIIKLKNRNAV